MYDLERHLHGSKQEKDMHDNRTWHYVLTAGIKAADNGRSIINGDKIFGAIL